MKNEITVERTKGFLTAPVGKEWTARFRTVDAKGSHSFAFYGSTAESARAKLMAEIEARKVNSMLSNEKVYAEV
jgi:hypothetical protein